MQVAKQLKRIEASKQILAAGQQAQDLVPPAQGNGAVRGNHRMPVACSGPSSVQRHSFT